MEEAEENIDLSEKPVDPDIIDLPRRAIGTPQVLAGFIFLLSLVMLEGVYFAFESARDAQRTVGYLQDSYKDSPHENTKASMSVWTRKMYFGYSAVICLTVGALGLAFGAISLAFALGTGRRWTIINIILMPVTVGAALSFLYYSLDIFEDVALPLLILGILLVPFAIVLGRMVQWIAPVRDFSPEGRDRLRRSHLSRACIATVVISGFMHIPIWAGIANYIDNRIYFSVVHFEYWATFVVFFGVIIFISILFGLRRWRPVIFLILAWFILIGLTFFGESLYKEIGMVIKYPENKWKLLFWVPPILVFLYPFTALAVMLVRPLGKKLFSPES